MNAKRCGVAATIGGVAVTWLCLASGDGGIGASATGSRFLWQSAKAGALQSDVPSEGVPNDSDIKSWLSDALAGDPRAAFQLAKAYTAGQSRKEDFAEAAYWLRRAAQAGHGPAQADLAMLYGKGLGVPQDYVWSYAWFAAAAENMPFGSARDQTLEMRDMMSAFVSPEERPRAERLAKQLIDLRGD